MGSYRDLNTDYKELETHFDKKFVAVKDLWDSMEMDSRKVLLNSLSDEGIIELENIDVLSNSKWKKLPIEIKMLVIALEININLDPDI